MLDEILWGSLGRVFEISDDDWSNKAELVRIINVIHNYACGFFELAMVLEQMHNGLGAIVRGDTDENGWLPDIYIMVLDNTAKWCKSFGFRVTESKCRTCIDLLREMSWEHLNKENMEELAREGFELRKSFVIECENERFLRIYGEDVAYYENPQFTENVRNRFPTAIYDMQESGKCFALRRYTACAFHLMRVVESGLVEFKSFLTVDKNCPSWDSILKALNRHIDSLANNGEKEKYRKIISRVYAIKDAWRNPTMHVEYKYNEDEAREVFVATKNFMKILCDELS